MEVTYETVEAEIARLKEAKGQVGSLSLKEEFHLKCLETLLCYLGYYR